MLWVVVFALAFEKCSVHACNMVQFAQEHTEKVNLTWLQRCWS